MKNNHGLRTPNQDEHTIFIKIRQNFIRSDLHSRLMIAAGPKTFLSNLGLIIRLIWTNESRMASSKFRAEIKQKFSYMWRGWQGAKARRERREKKLFKTHTPHYHLLYTFHISFKFCVSFKKSFEHPPTIIFRIYFGKYWFFRKSC